MAVCGVEILENKCLFKCVAMFASRTLEINPALLEATIKTRNFFKQTV